MQQAEWRVGLFWGQILWSLSGTKVEFLMKQKCSALNLEALLMLLKACASIATQCLKFHSQRLLPSGQIRNPLKPVAKIPLISTAPALGSLFLSLSIFGCPAGRWLCLWDSLRSLVLVILFYALAFPAAKKKGQGSQRSWLSETAK